MELFFYNHFGVGDLFESREFALEWMRVCRVEKATYACRFPAVFEDLPQIECVPFNPNLDMRMPASKRAKRVMVNTWIGALNGNTKPKGDYVIWPGVGCTVEGLFRMHSDYMRMIGFPALKGPVTRFLSDIDYSRVNLGKTDEFRKAHFGKRMILICNGATGSAHAENFDMARMVELLPESDDVFIFSQRCEVNRPNVYFTDDITERGSRSDIFAISYLSRFCSMIVGRCSGAQMPCETRENWNDPNKILVSFTHHKNGACFVHEPEKHGLKMRLFHSTASTPEEAASFLQSIR